MCSLLHSRKGPIELLLSEIVAIAAADTAKSDKTGVMTDASLNQL